MEAIQLIQFLGAIVSIPRYHGIYGRGDGPEFNENVISKLIVKIWKINRMSIPA
jgi:hypothetical protein